MTAPDTATADAPAHTGSRGTRVLGVLAALGVTALVPLAFAVSGPDTQLGESVRLIYVHVPAASMTYLACFLVTVGSAMVLWKRSEWWNLVAAAAAELAAVFCAVTLVSGSLWGRASWGTYWEWDARLTSTAMLFLLVLGYNALRRAPADPVTQARRAAIVGCLLVPNVVIVNRSVEWWRSLHQQSTLIRLDPQIEGWQLFTLFVGFVAIGLVFAWLLVHRFRVAWLRHQLAEHEIADALTARRAEAGVPA